MLKYILEPHTWLCWFRDDLDSLVGGKKGCVVWGCASLCPLRPQVPPGVTAQVELPGTNCGLQGGTGAGGSRWAPFTTATASEMQGTYALFPAKGVPRDFCSGLSLIKRKLWATPCAATWFGTQRGKILSHPIPGEGVHGLRFHP